MTIHDAQKEQEIYRKALARLKELKQENNELRQAAQENIAIVGMAVRFPGISSLEGFWAHLLSGRSTIGPIPGNRWAEGFDDGKAPPDGSYFQKVEDFDAQEFGVQDQELLNLDPQQKMFLETATEALQDAAISRPSIRGSRTGVFVGVCSNDYAYRSDLPDNQYSVSGTAFSFIPGRLSFALDLQGPSVAVDTACSSSLVAVHQACQSLRAGECSLAFAGAVNLVASPRSIQRLKKTRALSSKGKCRTFDAQADGFVRGEGSVVILLKRLKDAVRDGDRIHAIIRASAIGHDGMGTGLTAPNVLSQSELIREAIDRSGLKAQDIGYIETHGTGTILGDPIECDAIRQALGDERHRSLCYLGTLKPAIGHTEGAAGLAGLVKLALVVSKGIIPANVGFEQRNPLIELDPESFVFPTKNTEWKANCARRGGVSSFGMAGTNAHVILEEYYEKLPRVAEKQEGLLPIVLVAPNEKVLSAYCSSLITACEQVDCNLHDLAYTLARRHSGEPGRMMMLVSSLRELKEKLQQPQLFLRPYSEPLPAIKQARVCALPLRPWDHQCRESWGELLYSHEWVECQTQADFVGPIYVWDLQQESLHALRSSLDIQAITASEALQFERLDSPCRLLIQWPDLGAEDYQRHGQAFTFFQRLVRLLSRLNDKQVEHILLVTHRVWQPSGEACRHLDMLWGAYPGLRHEFPNLSLAILDQDDLHDSGQGLWDALHHSPKENRWRVMQGQLRVQRLKPFKDEAVLMPRTSTAGTYVITGGMGAIGQELIRTLAGAGVRNIVVLTRRLESELSTSAQKFLEELRRRLSLRLIPCDIRDRDALKKALSQVDGKGPLRIYHAAGIFEAHELPTMSEADFYETMAAKAIAAAHLLDLSPAMDLEELILFSSVSASWGTPGYTLYSAANGALQHLARLARARGIKARSLELGPWNLQGMGSEGQRQALERSGLHLLEPASALELIVKLSRIPAMDHVLVDASWNTFLPLIEKNRRDSLFAALRPASATISAVEPHSDSKEVMMTEHELIASIRMTLSTIMKTQAETIDTRLGLFEIGLDSLSSITLLEQLQQLYGVELGIAAIYNHPSIEKLAHYLHGLGVKTPETFSPGPQEQVKESSDQLPNQAIAVIGMAGRFPGDAQSPDEFWDLLMQGGDGVRPSRERWTFCGQAPTEGQNDMGLLKNVDHFDAGYFQIPRREAISMDPQQRFLMEVTVEALMDAGLGSWNGADQKIGVFVGASNCDYADLLKAQGTDGIDAYFASGTSLNSLAGRISYQLGWQGPAMTVDTACSSSLVALHLAVQSLRNGESQMALAAGVNLILSPFHSHAAVQGHMLSPDSRCKTFDASANGFVRAEACAVLMLKPLSQALADGDRIHGIIRGTAVNHDGRSNGFTVPNGEAQKKVYQDALQNAGLEASSIDYIEAHGTATGIGDPIEVDSIQAIYGRDRATALVIGSVKSNLGHMESAAGMGGLIKVLKSFQEEKIPANLHFKTLNPHIRLKGLQIATETRPWPRRDRPRRAAVSGFGFSGINAHIVLEEASLNSPARSKVEAAEVYSFTISGHTELSLQGNIRRLRDYLQKNPEVSLRDLSFTLGRRKLEKHSKTCVAAAYGDLLKALSETPGDSLQHGRLAFLCSGQGSQNSGMGLYLYEQHAAFRAVVDECSDYLEPLIEHSLKDLMFDERYKHLINETQYTQPLLYVYEVALGRLLMERGWKPDVLIGHSVGEYAAACLAGVFSLKDGLRLIAKRGELMQMTAEGSMLAVSTDEGTLKSLLSDAKIVMDIAAVNGPRQVVVSGVPELVQAVQTICEAHDIRTKPVQVSHAFHSNTMDRILKSFAKELKRIPLKPAKIPLIANTDGTLSMDRFQDENYWLEQLRGTVRFHDCCITAIEQGVTNFVEIGPDQTLSLLGRLGGFPDHIQWHAAQARHRDQEQVFQNLLSLSLGKQGANDAQEASTGHLLSLPPYAWDQQRYWPILNSASIGSNQLSLSDFVHLGQRVDIPMSEDVIFATKRQALQPLYLDDHRLYGFVVAPAASHISMVASAYEQEIEQGKTVELSHVSFPQALVLGDDEEAELQLLARKDGETQTISCLSRKQKEWVTHMNARYLLKDEPPLKHSFSPAVLQEGARCISGEAFYAYFASLGYTLGPAFQWIKAIWQKGESSLSCLHIPAMRESSEKYVMYPGLIDSCFQTLAGMMYREDAEESDQLAIPFSAEKIRIHGRAEGELWCFVQGRKTVGSVYDAGDIQLFDHQGKLLLEVQGFRVRHAQRSRLEASLQAKTAPVYELHWQDRPGQPALPVTLNSWLILDSDTSRQKSWQQNAPTPVKVQVFSAAETLNKGLGILQENSLVLDARFLNSEGSEFDFPEVFQRISSDTWSLFESLKRAASSAWVQRYVILCNRDLIVFDALRALCLSLQSEFSHMQFQVVALDADTKDFQPIVAQELNYQDLECSLWFEDGQAKVPRMHAVTEQAETLTIRNDAAYLITGGLGALGQATARHLLARGAARVYLVGRRPFSQSIKETLDKLTPHETRLRYIAVDLDERSDVKNLLRMIEQEGLPLKGVFHAAGSLADKTLADMTQNDLRTVLSGKVQGAFNLSELTRDMELDAFVLYSSLSSFCGNRGQSNYAFANGLLDGLARSRRAQGLKALSISWGSWAGEGMAQGEHLQRKMERLGITPLQAAEALPVLDWSSSMDHAHIMAARVDWKRFVHQQFATIPAPFTTLVDPRELTPSEVQVEGWRQALENMPVTARPEYLAARLRLLIASILKEPVESLSFDRGFAEMGFDSIMVLDLKTRLDRAFGQSLPATLGLDYPSLERLTNFLLKYFELESRPKPALDLELLNEVDLMAVVAAELR